MKRKRIVEVFLLLAGLGLCAGDARGQVYGYTNEDGRLILSNIPSDPRMRLIAEGSPEAAGRIWRYSGQYDNLILKAATLARLDSTLIKAVIAIESGFNRFARSHKGAMGLMQLMPETCRRYGVSNPYNAWQNLRAGAQHLRDLLDEFNDLNLALAAYNAGATPVREHRRIPPYRETRNYVRKVMAIYRAGSKISITKGGRTYSIGPGGKTVVQAAPGANKSNRSQPVRVISSENSSLAEIAAATRRAAGRASVAPQDRKEVRNNTATNASGNNGKQVAQSLDRVPERTVASDTRAEPADGIERRNSSNTGTVPGTDGLLYYRYTDDNGVIYITRKKPVHSNYEILRR